MTAQRTLGSRGLQTGGLEYGRRAPSGEFSWIATISPLPSNRFAAVSVVVLRNRDRARDFPSVATTDPKENGVAERIAYVTFASGFRGGAGGTVHLTAAESTSTSLVAGDWIMLSRTVPGAPAVDFHRWYRVVSVDGDPEELTPFSNTQLESGGAALPDPGFRADAGLAGTKCCWTAPIGILALLPPDLLTVHSLTIRLPRSWRMWFQ